MVDEEKLTELLFDFVERVSKGNATSEKEVEVLPEMAKILLECFNL